MTALSAPHVTRIDLGYVYPSFAGLAPREEQDGGDIYAPAGTRVRLRVHADKPLVAGQLTLGGDRTVPLRPASDGTGEAEITLASDDSYRVSACRSRRAAFGSRQPVSHSHHGRSAADSQGSAALE